MKRFLTGGLFALAIFGMSAGAALACCPPGTTSTRDTSSDAAFLNNATGSAPESLSVTDRFSSISSSVFE